MFGVANGFTCSAVISKGFCISSKTRKYREHHLTPVVELLNSASLALPQQKQNSYSFQRARPALEIPNATKNSTF